MPPVHTQMCVYIYIYISTERGKSNLTLDTVVKCRGSSDFCATLYIMNFPIFFKYIRKERFKRLSSAWEAAKDVNACRHDLLNEEEVPD